MEQKDENTLSQKIRNKELRKLKAQGSKRSVWSGLGMMGMVGWSVAVPALLGVAAGIWLDKNVPESFSWILTLLILGMFFGSIIAWYWISNEDKEMNETKEDEK